MLGLSLIPLVLILGPLLVVLATGFWVYRDATALEDRGIPIVVSLGSFRVDTPVVWFLGCLLLWILFFPLYVTTRTQAA
jgi:hypothetical protein